MGQLELNTVKKIIDKNSDVYQSQLNGLFYNIIHLNNEENKTLYENTVISESKQYRWLQELLDILEEEEE